MRLTALRDRHKGERCVIVANGPSLSLMPRGFLRQEEHVIGLNKIFLGTDRFRFYPRYYVAVNPLVIAQSADAIRRLHCVRFIDHRARRSGALREDALTHFITEIHHVPFSTDLAAGYRQGHTVTHVALQVAYYLGYRQVILVGLDHRYHFSGPPGGESIQQGPDRNHFSPAYFAPGQKWENPNLAEAAKHFHAARRAFEKEGREILDATPDGACQAFPKVDYRTIFPQQS
jgi:hypothetical protein